ncbi:MAG: tetratricopeptide repeat protein [Rhodospirillales bacterium]|nr:tetratricopeptide repeat protein [Rhodospirillales bacterium]
MEQDEAGTFERLRAHRTALFEPEIARHRGRIFKLMGDGLLAEFASVVDAVECAVALQRGMAERNRSVLRDHRIDVRIGINLGDVIVEGEDRHGEGVNIAARLQEVAEPGGICVARNVYNQVKNKVDFAFESLGDHHVKNIAEPVSVYRVLADSMAKRQRPFSWPARMRERRHVMVALALMLPIIVGALVWNLRDQACALAPPDKPSIAVLPFENLSNDPRSARQADGLTEAVIRNLSRSSDLFVVAGNSTRILKGGGLDIRKVGCDLGVRYILDGEIQALGDKIRVTPRLIEATNGRLVWSEQLDGAPEEIFKIHDEVTANIAGRLLGYEGGLPEGEKMALGRKPPTDNLEAYDYYLRAETLGRGWSETQSEALALYQKAIMLDPNFADAYAGYARIVTDAWLYQYELRPAPVARKEAYEMASRALSLDPGNPGPYSILSALQTADGRHDQAIETARKAIALQPNSAEAHTYLARALTYAGRHAEALAAMETALRLDPNPSPQFRADLGWVLFYNRQYERALEELEKARDTGVAYPETLAMVYVKLNRLSEARSTVRKMLQGGTIPKRKDTLNLEFLRVQYSHYQRKEDLDELLDALRLAGMPEWPPGYQGRLEDRLDGRAVVALTFGRTWVGTGVDNRPFVQEINRTGTLVYRDTNSLHTGGASVEGNKLCQQSDAFLMGRKHCGYIYGNTDRPPEAQGEYVYVSPYAIYRFSVRR